MGSGTTVALVEIDLSSGTVLQAPSYVVAELGYRELYPRVSSVLRADAAGLWLGADVLYLLPSALD